MLKEVIRLVDEYKKGAPAINKESNYGKKFVMIKTKQSGKDIAYSGLEILSDDSKIKRWVDKNKHYEEVLKGIESYVFPSPRIPNKALGSTSGLITYCFFAFKLSEKNLESLKQKILKTKFEKAKKYRIHEGVIADIHKILCDAVKDMTKMSDSKYDFLGHYAVVVTDTQELKRWSEITCDFIKERTSGGNKSLSAKGRCYVCNKQDQITNPMFCTNYDANKIFLKHVTRYSKDRKGVPLKACGACVKKLNSFESILKDSKIKIFPLFIVPSEIREQIKIIKDNLAESQNRFSHILDQLAKRQKKNIFDFYLVVDSYDGYFFFDYISNYKWSLGEWENFYAKSTGKFMISRQQLESKLAYVLNEKGFIQYFDKVKCKDNQQKAVIYSFRQKIFDFVYRNQNSLTSIDLQNIILFRVEKKIISGQSLDTEIFNLFLNRHLLLSDEPKSGFLAIARKAFLDDPDFEINSDEEWAYFVGQTAYYLVSLSESSNKTVALLEPFINKSTTMLVKETLRHLVDQYKHKINLNNRRFKKITTSVLSYEIDKSFINLKIQFYIGVFDDNLIYQKSDK